MAGFSICSVKGCGKKRFCRGWCRGHYMRWWKHGDAGEDAQLHAHASHGKPLAFLRHTVSNPPSECVPWPYAKSDRGYGKVWFEGRHYAAHRLAWEIFNGRKLAKGMVAAHQPQVCHNPSCINPLHLREASNKENQTDRVLDGTELRGQKTSKCKLTEQQVLKIRQDPRALKEIADMYGVSISAISLIRRRKNWAWL